MAHKGIVYKVNLTEVWLFNVLDGPIYEQDMGQISLSFMIL